MCVTDRAWKQQDFDQLCPKNLPGHWVEIECGSYFFCVFVQLCSYPPQA